MLSAPRHLGTIAAEESRNPTRKAITLVDLTPENMVKSEKLTHESLHCLEMIPEQICILQEGEALVASSKDRREIGHSLPMPISELPCGSTRARIRFVGKALMNQMPLPPRMVMRDDRLTGILGFSGSTSRMTRPEAAVPGKEGLNEARTK